MGSLTALRTLVPLTREAWWLGTLSVTSGEMCQGVPAPRRVIMLGLSLFILSETLFISKILPGQMCALR